MAPAFSMAMLGMVTVLGCGAKRTFMGGAMSRVLDERSPASMYSTPGNRARSCLSPKEPSPAQSQGPRKAAIWRSLSAESS